MAACTIQRAWSTHIKKKRNIEKRRMAACIIQKAWRSVKARAKKAEEAKEAASSSAVCQQTIRWPLRPQDVLLYQTIGSGAFGKVWLAKEQGTWEMIAVKQLSKGQGGSEATSSNEVCLLHTVNDLPFCPSLRGAYQDKTHSYIAMEYIGGGTLLSFLVDNYPLEEDAVCFCCANIVSALQAVHKKGIIHGDVKPQNMLINDQGFVVLTDFGLASFAPNGKENDFQGTEDYMAPEFWMNLDDQIDASIDYWALGVVTINLLTGKMPWGGELVNQIMGDFSLPSSVSPAARHFIGECLTVDPEQRMSTNKNPLSHPWFRDMDIEGIQDQSADSPISPLMIATEGVPKRLTEVTTSYCSSTAMMNNAEYWNTRVWEPIERKSSTNSSHSQ